MMIPFSQYKKIVGQLPILCVDILIKRADGNYLLLKRHNAPLVGTYWPPGGRVLRGETLVAAAKRKVKEEVGLHIKTPKFVGYYEDFYPDNIFGLDYLHTVSAVFEVAINDAKKITLDAQSDDYRWSKTLPKRLKIKRP